MPSTVIRSFQYRGETRELEVVFTTGRRYVYFDVPLDLVEEFRGAMPKGRFFNARIRDRFAFRELAGTGS